MVVDARNSFKLAILLASSPSRASLRATRWPSRPVPAQSAPLGIQIARAELRAAIPTRAIVTDILGLVARVFAIPRRASGMHSTASLIRDAPPMGAHRPSGTLPRIRPLPGDELTMPAQDRVRRHGRRDLPSYLHGHSELAPGPVLVKKGQVDTGDIVESLGR